LTISVIIPVFNRADVLPRALRSALNQSYRDLEIIVVDDGSTDPIAAVVGDFPDPRVRLVRHETRRGAAAARNSGVRHARGDFVAFLDSDDEWYPEKLQRQLQVLAPAGDATMCVTWYDIYQQDQPLPSRTEHLVRTVGRPLRAAAPVELSRLDLLWGCNVSPGSTLLASKRSFLRVGFFCEELWRLEDWDWLLRATQFYKLAIVPLTLARIHNPSRSMVPSQVIAALDILRSRRQVFGLTWKHPASLLKFESTILLEKAALAWRMGAPGRTMFYGTCCFLVYPFRNRMFFQRAFAFFRGLLQGSHRLS
jgi:glycosyltransferase involved in cell wall biosynthesis